MSIRTKVFCLSAAREQKRNQQASNYTWVPDRVPEPGTPEYEMVAGPLTYERILAAHANGYGHS